MKREPLIFFVFGMVFGFPLGYMIHNLGEAAPTSTPATLAQGTPAESAPPQGPGTPATTPLDPSEVKALQSLAEREKGNAKVRVELANLLMDHGSFEDAIPWYKQALALQPDDPDVMVDMGACLVNAGRPGEALQIFDEALKKHPGHKKALYNKGVALMSSGRPKEAVALWEDLIKRYPDDPQLRGLKDQIDQVRATLPGRAS
jgi:tetratricopeptide (TPR) repeat protein